MLRFPEARIPEAPGCGVCGSRQVHTDAVEPVDRVEAAGPGELLLLAECGHCDHRWTRALPAPAGPGALLAVRATARVEPRELALPEVLGAA